MEALKKQRLFFALWPDKKTQMSIYHLGKTLTAQLNGRRISPEHIHLTLCFLGNQLPEARDKAIDVVNHLSFEAFDVVFDQLDYWKRPHVVCLTATQTPSALAGFANHLSQTLVQLGIISEDSHDFSAHITLMRKVTTPIQPILVEKPFIWSAQKVFLVESIPLRQGVEYQPLYSWEANPSQSHD